MDDLLKTLQAASSHETNIRVPAERMLKSWEENFFGDYIIGLCTVLKSTDVDQNIRVLAGLQVKNLVGGGRTQETQATLTRRYFALSEDVRANVRNEAVSVLAANLPDARRVAAQIVAKIAVIELPQGMWPELVDMLTTATMGDNPDWRESGLLTLGFIGEESGDDGQVMDKLSGLVLNAVQTGVTDQNNLNVRLAGSKAMLHCLPHIEANIVDEEAKQKILELIFLCCITEGSGKIEVQTRTVGFQCLARIATLYYDHLDSSMQLCAQITLQAIKDDQSEEVRKQSIEFWSCIFEQELQITKDIQQAEKLKMNFTRQNKNYAQKAVEPLCPILLQSLKRKNNVVDDDDWSLPKSAAACLGFLSRCVKDNILQTVLMFVQQELTQNNWQGKEAGTNAFGLILDGPSPAVLKTIVSQVWEPLLQNLMSGEPIVRDITAWTIGRIFEFCPDSVEENVLKQIVNVFCQCLPQTHSKVSASICFAIGRLARLCRPNDPTNALSPFLVELLTALLKTAGRNDVESDNLLPATFEAINSLVRTSGNDIEEVLSSQLLPEMVKQVANLVQNIDTAGDIGVCRTGELIGTISQVVTKIGRCDDSMAQVLMEIYGNTLNSKFSSTVHEEAMAAIGDIAFVIGSRFVQYLERAAQMVCVGLNEGHMHPKLCSSAVLVLDSIAQACKEKIQPFADTFIQLLLALLKNDELEFELKPHVVVTIGTVAEALGIQFSKYCQIVLRILLEAGAQSPGENPNPEEIAKFNQLRISVLEAITYILLALQNNNNCVVMHFGDVLQMIMMMDSKYPSDKVKYLILCVIEDMLACSPQQCLSHLFHQQKYIESTLNAAQQSSMTETRESASRLQRKIARSISR